MPQEPDVHQDKIDTTKECDEHFSTIFPWGGLFLVIVKLPGAKGADTCDDTDYTSQSYDEIKKDTRDEHITLAGSEHIK